jgi:LPS export ABC transporter protein LptC
MGAKMTVGRMRLLKRLLMVVMVGICLIVVTIYIGYRHFRRDARVWVQAVPRQAFMSMDQVHHTATRDGRTEWILDAQRAQAENGGDLLSLTGLAVRFFPPEGGPVNLMARKGRLQTRLSDIEVQDHVVVENETYRLETEQLRYDHAGRQVRIPGAVRIVSGDNVISASAMTVFIDESRAELSGEVKGVFSGTMLW